MLKITNREHPTGTTLRLEGKLVRPWVDAFQRALAEAGEREGTLHLDLAGLTFVDAEGACVLLAGLRSTSLEVRGTSALVRELLRAHEAPGVPEPEPRTDDAEFEAVVRREAADLLAWLRRLVPDEREALRIVETAFRDAPLAHRAPATWGDPLRGCALRAVLATWHAAGDDDPAADELPRFTPDGRWLDPPPGVVPDPSDPRTRTRVRALIAGLPTPLRVVHVLCDVEGCAVDDVARWTGLPAHDVRAHRHRARRLLCAKLAGTRQPAVA